MMVKVLVFQEKEGKEYP